METAEILNLFSSTLKMLYDMGIKMEDVLYLDLYNDFKGMKAHGDKTSYVVTVLSERYGICERKVYKILQRMRKRCHLCTA